MKCEMFLITKVHHKCASISSDSKDNFYIYCPVTELRHIVEDTRYYSCPEYICHIAIRCSTGKIVSLEEIYDTKMES